MTRVYLDACTIIYLIEAEAVLHEQAVERLSDIGDDPDAQLITSRLTRLECRTRPLREGDASLLERYEVFFARQRLVLAEVSAAVIERATVLRAVYGFKTPDAIHLATAIAEQADLFLTGDKGLTRCQEILVETLSEA